MQTEQSPTLLGRVREVIRYKHYSQRTEKAYVGWVRRFVVFHGRRHPREMGAAEVRDFLAYLANELKVAAATHQQALSALLFLYKDVLGIELPWLAELERPKKPKRMPAVLSRLEVERLFQSRRARGGFATRWGGATLKIALILRSTPKNAQFPASTAKMLIHVSLAQPTIRR